MNRAYYGYEGLGYLRTLIYCVISFVLRVLSSASKIAKSVNELHFIFIEPSCKGRGAR
ncbi:hypothetical protein BDW75DRAFT_212122 [Aspergillus navahoensis]